MDITREMARPKKPVRVYYKNAVLLDDETYRYVLMHKYPKEPLGSVVHRLIGKTRARQGDDLKKYEALQQPEERKQVDCNILDSSDDFNTIWNLIENQPSIVEEMLNDE